MVQNEKKDHTIKSRLRMIREENLAKAKQEQR